MSLPKIISQKFTVKFLGNPADKPINQLMKTEAGKQLPSRR